MQKSKPVLSSIAFSVGTSQPIEMLNKTAGVSTDTLLLLKERGLENFCEDIRSMPDICLATARDTLKTSSLQPDRVGAVIFSNSSPDWTPEEETALFKGFYELGFPRKYIVGLGLQACSGCGSALRVASDLVSSMAADNVLVLLTGQAKNNAKRIGPQADTILSDGAASCVVSSSSGQFEILASESQTNTYLGSLEQSPDNSMLYLEDGFADLAEVTSRAYGAAGVGPEEIAMMFATNGSLTYLNLMAEAAGIPMERVYSQDLTRYAHVHSCDSLISLKTYASTHPLVTGNCYLLLAWSSYVMSASILRYQG